MSLRQNIRCLLKRASRSVMNCTKIEFRQQIEEYSGNTLSSTDTVCSILSITTENRFDLFLIVLVRTENTFAWVVVH